VIWGSHAYSQTSDEFFKQKVTQKEYLIIQVGALRLQSRLLKEAGQIASLGLNSINVWRDLEKELHADFFASHRNLGPLAKQTLERLMDSQANPTLLASKITKSKNTWISESQDEFFLTWISQVHSGMLTRLDLYVEDLKLVVGVQLEISDGERAKLIQGLEGLLLKLHEDLAAFQHVAKVRLAQSSSVPNQFNYLVY
jgi:hypothetical protein